MVRGRRVDRQTADRQTAKQPSLGVRSSVRCQSVQCRSAVTVTVNERTNERTNGDSDSDSDSDGERAVVPHSLTGSLTHSQLTDPRSQLSLTSLTHCQPVTVTVTHSLTQRRSEALSVTVRSSQAHPQTDSLIRSQWNEWNEGMNIVQAMYDVAG